MPRDAEGVAEKGALYRWTLVLVPQYQVDGEWVDLPAVQQEALRLLYGYPTIIEEVRRYDPQPANAAPSAALVSRDFIGWLGAQLEAMNKAWSGQEWSVVRKDASAEKVA